MKISQSRIFNFLPLKGQVSRHTTVKWAIVWEGMRHRGFLRILFLFNHAHSGMSQCLPSASLLILFIYLFFWCHICVCKFSMHILVLISLLIADFRLLGFRLLSLLVLNNNVIKTACLKCHDTVSFNSRYISSVPVTSQVSGIYAL